jgi:hypothetical protein
MKVIKKLKKVIFEDIKFYFFVLVFIELCFLTSFFLFFLNLYLKLVDTLAEISVKSELMLSNIDIEGMNYQDLTSILNQQEILVGLLHDSYKIVGFLILGLFLIYLVFNLANYFLILRKISKKVKYVKFLTFLKRFIGINIIYFCFGFISFYIFAKLSIISASFNIIILNNLIKYFFIVFVFTFLYIIYQGYRLLLKNTILKTIRMQFLNQNRIFKTFFINFSISLISFLVFLVLYLFLFYNGFFITSIFYLLLILIPLLVLIRINQVLITVKYNEKE